MTAASKARKGQQRPTTLLAGAARAAARQPLCSPKCLRLRCLLLRPAVRVSAPSSPSSYSHSPSIICRKTGRPRWAGRAAGSTQGCVKCGRAFRVCAKTPATPSQPLNTHQAVWPPHGLQLALLPSSALGRLRVGGQSRLSLCGNLCCLRQHGWRVGVAGCKGEGESASG